MIDQDFLPDTEITDEMKAEAKRLWLEIDLQRTEFVPVVKMQGVYPHHAPRPFEVDPENRVVVPYGCSRQTGSKLTAYYIPPGIPGLADICFIYFPNRDTAKS